MSKIKSFLDRKIVTKDVGEETYITWREALSYAMGRGAQGMSTSMTASKYVNFFITDVLHIKARHASNIRLYCGIFDAINDPIMGVIVDKTRTKYGKMRPYIKFAPYFVSLFMLLFFIGNDSLSYGAKIALTVFAFVGLDVTYTAFDVPMGALAFSMTPNGTERTKLYGVASIGRMILGAIPARLVASGACEKGIVICTTGIGISIAANKVKGIRCAHCTDSLSAEMTRRHNDANVLALGAGITGPNLAKRIVEVFLNTEFEGGRHARRVGQLDSIQP